MKILGIETSCDETAAAIVEGELHAPSVRILSNIVSTSLSLHAKTGGIIPEIAAREQLRYMLPVIEKALSAAGLSKKSPDIDAIAVTYGPGLIGSLLVGVETAKTLSYVWNKPLIPINHLYGHIYANWIESTDYSPQPTADIQFPALALIVSGAHTDLVLLKAHGDIQWLGGTRDDAAGEAFDKIGRILGLPYPAGPAIAKLAEKGNPRAFEFPRPLIGSGDFDFSFSGLKTSVFNKIKSLELKSTDKRLVADICASVQHAIVTILTRKTIAAAKKYTVKSILLGGGVAANQKLQEVLVQTTKDQRLETTVFVPERNLCTDNAAMIAATAFYNHKESDWKKVVADPELYFD